MGATARSRSGRTYLLREIILEHLSKRFGKTSAELREEVESDLGSISTNPESSIRILLRHVAYLIRVGCVRRDQEWDLEIGQHRPTYFLVDRRMPGAQRSFCAVCGMIGTRTSSHPLHLRIRRYVPDGKLTYVPFPKFRRAARLASGGSPGSPQPAASADPPAHRPSAARRAR